MEIQTQNLVDIYLFMYSFPLFIAHLLFTAYHFLFYHNSITVQDAFMNLNFLTYLFIECFFFFHVIIGTWFEDLWDLSILAIYHYRSYLGVGIGWFGFTIILYTKTKIMMFGKFHFLYFRFFKTRNKTIPCNFSKFLLFFDLLISIFRCI